VVELLKEMSVEILRKCPNKCVHCSSNSSLTCSEIIPYELFCSIIRDAVELGLKTVCFSGGEPILHPDFIKMIDYVNSLKLQSYIYTSGIYVDESNNPNSIPLNILDSIKDKATKLILNIEAANESTYDFVMGTKGNFKYMKKSIKDANKIGILTEAHFVPMRLNIREIDETVRLCNELGVSKISFLRLVLHGRALSNQSLISLSEEETQQLKLKLQELSKSSTLKIRIGVPLSGENNKHYCEAAKGKLNIRYDGNVYPCEVFKNNKVRFIDGFAPDNIFDAGIKEIYEHSKYLCKVRDYINNFAGVKTCENCIGQYYIKSVDEEVR